MDWVITYSLMAIAIGVFYLIVYKRKENFVLASLVVLYYILSFTVVGMLIFNLKSILSYLLNFDLSWSISGVMFLGLKVLYFISIPIPVILAYYNSKKILQEDKNDE